MKTFAAYLPILVLSAFPEVRSAMPDSPIFEKGEDIRPLLERNRILEAEAHRGEMRKRELRKNAYLALRLDEPADECVASDPSAGSCLVSVGEFNRNLETWEFDVGDQEREYPSPEDAKRERAALLKSLLDEKYLETYLPTGQSQDSLNRLFDSARSDRVQAFRARRGDSAYRTLYGRHFARLFQGREVRRYLALATSDSAVADSLREEIELLRVDADGARHGAPSLPWRQMAEEDLPPELLPAAAALRRGDIAGPLETSYGHIFLRLHSARRTPDVGFEDAMPALISLLDAPSGHEKRVEDAVATYYSRNSADFTASDTVQYRAWLLPDGKRKAGMKKRDRIREDTARVKPLSVEAALLPRVLREELELYHPVQPGELLGPIRSLFGIWYFQPLEIRKGARRLSLDEVRPRIRELLFGKAPLSPETSALREAETKDRDLWKSLVGEYLLRKAEAGSQPEAYRRLERDKEDWMRHRLQFRHVEWAGYAPIHGMEGK